MTPCLIVRLVLYRRFLFHKMDIESIDVLRTVGVHRGRFALYVVDDVGRRGRVGFVSRIDKGALETVEVDAEVNVDIVGAKVYDVCIQFHRPNGLDEDP
jgi:hypothetical protein